MNLEFTKEELAIMKEIDSKFDGITLDAITPRRY